MGQGMFDGLGETLVGILILVAVVMGVGGFFAGRAWNGCDCGFKIVRTNEPATTRSPK